MRASAIKNWTEFDHLYHLQIMVLNRFEMTDAIKIDLRNVLSSLSKIFHYHLNYRNSFWGRVLFLLLKFGF